VSLSWSCIDMRDAFLSPGQVLLEREASVFLASRMVEAWQVTGSIAYFSLRLEEIAVPFHDKSRYDSVRPAKAALNVSSTTHQFSRIYVPQEMGVS